MLKIAKLYSVSNSSKLLRFLEKNRHLIPIVFKAYKEIRKRFPSEKLILESVSDPEAENEEEVFVYILTSLSVGEAIARLNNLDEEWFLSELPRTKGLFNFNLRFVEA